MNLLTLIFFGGLQVFAGDKINNGGGLWVCHQNQEIQQAFLIDLFEAKEEMGLQIVNRDGEVFQIVEQIEKNLIQNLPDYGIKWSDILKDTRSKIRYVNTELVLIDDALYRIRPLRSTCAAGWEYTQFANYTNMNYVLIRQDLWESPRVSSLDKAALIWHEVIYRWMRQEFQDTNSIRARQIVGLLFSDLSAQDLRKSIQKILTPSLEPNPEKPIWVCRVENTYSSQIFLDYGLNQLAALSKSMRNCQEADSDFSVHCSQQAAQCDSFISNTPRYTCSVEFALTYKMYTETGRSRIEAEGKALLACLNANPAQEAIHCHSGPITCE